MKILERIIEEKDWLEVRRKGVGGSDIAAACGVSPWVGRYELWLDKTGILPRNVTAEHLEIGKTIEKFIIEMFLSKNPDYEFEGDFVCQHPEFDFALYTPDGIVTKGADRYLLEIKNVGEFAAMKNEWKDGEIPFHYYCQVQWGLFVTGLKKAWFVHLRGGNRYHETVVDRDEDMISNLLCGAKAFWHLVETRQEPPKDGSEGCRSALDKIWKREIAELDQETFLDLKISLENYKVAESQLEEVKNEIKAKMKKGQLAIYAGQKVATWTAQTQSRLDTKKLKEELPEIYHKYTKTITSTVFRTFV